MTETALHEEVLSPHLSRYIRTEIEQRYYAVIARRCRIEHAMEDKSFLADLDRHMALFPDHGVVHVRDVALAFLTALDTVHGHLIPHRPPARLAWMQAAGALLAYLHDIGLASPAPDARAAHPEYVARAALGPELDWLVEALAADGGVLVDRLATLPSPRPERALRELMALAMGHSKTRVPVDLLNHPAALARALRLATGSAGDRFAWMESGDEFAELRDDAIDCVRVLRAADALRQRGTVLKTSGGYEIFLDRESARAVYALRLDNGRSLLLELPDGHNAAEANLSSSELDPRGNLRLAFHHGRFGNAGTTAGAADAAARLVSDVQRDVIQSFRRPDGEASGPAATFRAARLLIEGLDDNHQFADMIIAALDQIDPEAATRCLVVPSLNSASRAERQRYLKGEPFSPEPAAAARIHRLAVEMGLRPGHLDTARAFTHVHRVKLTAGETLIEAGEPSGLVYIPETEGLAGLPLGGYPGFRVHAWALLGATGVVRGAVRNSTIAAETDVTLLAIPGPVYLRHWHRTFTPEAFAAAMRPQDLEAELDLG